MSLSASSARPYTTRLPSRCVLTRPARRNCCEASPRSGPPARPTPRLCAAPAPVARSVLRGARARPPSLPRPMQSGPCLRRCGSTSLRVP
jgi:hypothetical protein